MRHYIAILLFLCAAPVYAEEPEAPAAEAVAEAEAAPAEAGESEEAVPESFDDAAESVSLLVKAVQDKNWSLVLGLLLTLLVFGANKLGLKERVGSKAVPWVATAVAVAATSGVGLVSGVALADAAVQGLLAGVVAIGGWEMLFKHLLKSKAAS